jgi:hypothetical protein
MPCALASAEIFLLGDCSPATFAGRELGILVLQLESVQRCKVFCGKRLSNGRWQFLGASVLNFGASLAT